MKVIVGLGNPGQEYENTRHSVCFVVLDKLGTGFRYEKKFNSEVAKTDSILLIKPQTFMNNSGEAVQKIVNFYKIDLQDLYVIHDDLDIRLGEYKIQFGKGPKVHNGVSSIEQALGTKDFWRVRIGIDNKDVLGKFLPEEKGIIEGVIDEINAAVAERL